MSIILVQAPLLVAANFKEVTTSRKQGFGSGAHKLILTHKCLVQSAIVNGKVKYAFTFMFVAVGSFLVLRIGTDFKKSCFPNK